MRRAWWLLTAAAGCVLGGGALLSATWQLSYWHGVYCALGTASTVGCDATPPDGPARIASVLVMLTAIPLLAACFGQLHLDKVRAHVDTRLSEHHDTIRQRLDKIESEGK